MNLIERVKNLLIKPKDEWRVIDTEQNSGMPLIMSYLFPLAIAAALATFVGYAFLTRFGTVKYGLIYALIALVQLFISVYVNAIITDALAPSFESQKNLGKSIQLVVYSATPVFLGSLLNVFPPIGWLGMIAGGVYSVYLLFLGIPVLKKTPEDKVPIYLLLIIVVLAILYWLIGYIMARIIWTSTYGMPHPF